MRKKSAQLGQPLAKLTIYLILWVVALLNTDHPISLPNQWKLNHLSWFGLKLLVVQVEVYTTYKCSIDNCGNPLASPFLPTTRAHQVIQAITQVIEITSVKLTHVLPTYDTSQLNIHKMVKDVGMIFYFCNTTTIV